MPFVITFQQPKNVAFRQFNRGTISTFWIFGHFVAFLAEKSEVINLYHRNNFEDFV